MKTQKVSKKKAAATVAVADRVEQFKTELLAHATRRGELADAAQARFNESGNETDKKAAKLEQTHVKANTLLALAGHDAIAAMLDIVPAITADSVNALSREWKERAAVVFAAIGSGSRISGDRKHGDRAADAAVQYIFATVGNEYTLTSIQRQMMHDTPTQAGYFASFVELCGAGHKVKGGISINRESGLFVALAKCYGMMPPAPASITIESV